MPWHPAYSACRRWPTACEGRTAVSADARFGTTADRRATRSARSRLPLDEARLLRPRQSPARTCDAAMLALAPSRLGRPIGADANGAKSPDGPARAESRMSARWRTCCYGHHGRLGFSLRSARRHFATLGGVAVLSLLLISGVASAAGGGAMGMGGRMRLVAVVWWMVGGVPVRGRFQWRMAWLQWWSRGGFRSHGGASRPATRQVPAAPRRRLRPRASRRRQGLRRARPRLSPARPFGAVRVQSSRTDRIRTRRTTPTALRPRHTTIRTRAGTTTTSEHHARGLPEIARRQSRAAPREIASFLIPPVVSFIIRPY